MKGKREEFGGGIRWLYALILFIFLTPQRGWGQVSNTMSPHSQVGLGLPLREGYNRSLGMGSVSQGLRNKNMVNVENPASYTAQDSLSVIFDVALGGRYEQHKLVSTPSKHSGAGFVHHLALQFPVGKWCGMAAGFQPHTEVGYDVLRYEEDPMLIASIGRIRYHHKGHGGTNKAFLGAGFGPWKGVSLGLNMNYIFGSINTEQNVYFPNTNQYANVHRMSRDVIRAFSLAPALQYEIIFADTLNYIHSLTLGASAHITPVMYTDTRLDLSMEYLNRSITLLENWKTEGKKKLQYPIQYQFGVLYHWQGLSVAVDASYCDWQHFSLTGNSSLQLDSKQYDVRFGIEFVPSLYELRRYMRRVAYRCGGYFKQLPIEEQGAKVYDCGVTLGMGFPFRWSPTVFHLSIVAGMRSTLRSPEYTSHYVELILGASLNDFWFFKRKYD